MLLEYCANEIEHLRPGLRPECLRAAEQVLAKRPAPFAADIWIVQAVVSSRLLTAVRAAGGRRLPEGEVVELLTSIGAPDSALFARLLDKGRMLYEHCVGELSAVCVLGFVEYELRKSEASRAVMLSFLGWMARRQAEASSAADPACQEIRTVILDRTVSLVHGLSFETACRLMPDPS